MTLPTIPVMKGAAASVIACMINWSEIGESEALKSAIVVGKQMAFCRLITETWGGPSRTTSEL